MGLFGWLSGNQGKKTAYGISTEELQEIVLAADQGDFRAKQRLLELFDRGLSADEHNRIRLNLYQPLAEQGSAAAQRWMGLLTNQNPELSCQWYQKAAVQGDVEAMKALALGYSEIMNEDNFAPYPGFGHYPELELSWLKKAAEAGDSEAQCSLAKMCESGDNVEKDIDQAIYWYTEACKLDYAPAFLALGQLYNCPLHNQYDVQTAIKYFLQAVDTGNQEVVAGAAQELGVYYGSCYIFNTPKLDQHNANESLYWLSQAYILGDNPYVKE